VFPVSSGVYAITICFFFSDHHLQNDVITNCNDDRSRRIPLFSQKAAVIPPDALKSAFYTAWNVPTGHAEASKQAGCTLDK
jgi:hypothetical protein